jgi:2-phospho-L-lactate/phosphoenolpyruvate guanylyltransferase
MCDGAATLRAVTSAAVVVPVKAFRAAKLRLSPVLDSSARATLARDMAGTVLAAAAPLPVVVVCDDDEVHLWARQHGATTVWCPGRGLNGAVVDGVAWLGAEGIETAVVAHADLPLATELAWVADFAGVSVVPDRRRDGTNVIAVPTGAGFEFSYGRGSFRRHQTEAERLGLACRVVEDAALAWDVDLPADLDWPAASLKEDGPTAAEDLQRTGGDLRGPAR